MNREEFRQHFIQSLSALGIQDYEDIHCVVEPCVEIDKIYNGFDSVMRLVILPDTKILSFEQIVGMLNSQEGYFPCWIDVSKRNGQVFLKTSLRMRKVQKKDNTGTFPFRVVAEYRTVDLSERLPHILRHRYYFKQIRGSMFASNDIYDRIPSTYCILPTSDDKTEAEIAKVLESFKGNCKWCIFKGPFSKKNIYVISIEEYKLFEEDCFQKELNYSALEYYGEESYKALCDKALDDMEQLCDWVYEKLYC